MRRRRRYSSRDVGKVRERLAVKIAAQLTADGWKARVNASDLWPAQGRWRSNHRMDVMRWEGHRRDRPGLGLAADRHRVVADDDRARARRREPAHRIRRSRLRGPRNVREAACSHCRSRTSWVTG